MGRWRSRLNCIASLERQIRNGGKHLRLRQHIGRAGLCERPLRRCDIQETAHAILVRLKLGSVRLVAGFEQSQSGLPLAKSGFQI